MSETDLRSVLCEVFHCCHVCPSSSITLSFSIVFPQVQNDHVAPIFVINLLISDLIQLCCMIFEVAKQTELFNMIFLPIYDFCLMASILSMVCIALER